MGEIEKFELGSMQHVSLDLNENLKYEEWLDIGESLINQAKHIMWWLGDWWNYGDRKYGELAAQALDFGIPYSTFSNAAYVSNKIPAERRVPELSWTHHFEVAYLEDDKKIDKFLKEAYENKQSVRELRANVKKFKIKALNAENEDFNIVEKAGVNLKTSNVWTFGKPDSSYGLDQPFKTPPQMIANLLYWFTDGGEKIIVDITDKYQVTYDLGKKLGYEVFSYDLNPARGTKQVMPADFSVSELPKEVKEADIVILNMLDFIDDPDDLDPPAFQRQILIDLGVAMKKGSRLFLITKDFDDMKLENLFSLIYDENDFAVNEFISTSNKYMYNKDDEALAIKDKLLLDKLAYILVLENQAE